MFVLLWIFKGVNMKQVKINGLSANYVDYGDMIMLLAPIGQLGIENGFMISHKAIKEGVFELHGKQYIINLDI